MRKFLYIIIVCSILMSCGVPQADYDNLEAENKQLKKEVEKLKTDKKESEERKRLASLYTNIYALGLLKDYYGFYNADMIYRNPKIRRVSYNEFEISLEECFKKGGFSGNDFFWKSRVLSLIIHDDGTYTFN